MHDDLLASIIEAAQLLRELELTDEDSKEYLRRIDADLWDLVDTAEKDE